MHMLFILAQNKAVVTSDICSHRSYIKLIHCVWWTVVCAFGVCWRHVSLSKAVMRRDVSFLGFTYKYSHLLTVWIYLVMVSVVAGVNRITYWSQGVPSLLRKCQPPSSLPDNIRVMVIVWRLRGNIIRTAPCWVVWHYVHIQQHTHMSSSYRSSRSVYHIGTLTRCVEAFA